MTIKESLMKWLNLYENFEIEDFIETDLVENSGGYAVSKEPTVNIVTFNDGTQQRTEYYTFMAKKYTVNENQRRNNDEFLEQFQDWIFLKDLNCDYPTFDNATCDKIGLSSTYYLESTQDKLGMYIFTIELTYRKELKNG